MPLPSLPGLEAFEAVARLGSFTRAADSLHVTQSAISHRIKALEAQLGCALFVRRARSVELTPQGQALAEPAQRAFEQLRDGVRALERERGDGVLTISCSPSFAIRWLVPRLPQLAAALPELRVRLDADDRLAEPGRHGIDACLRYGAGGYPGVAHTRLSTERVSPVCSPQLGLSRLEELASHTLLHDEVLREHPGRVGWRRWLEAAGVDGVDPDAGPRFSHAHMAIEAAIAGQGVALGRTTLVARDLAEGRLVQPFELEVEAELGYWLLTPRGAASARVQAFERWLLAEVAGGPGGEREPWR